MNARQQYGPELLRGPPLVFIVSKGGRNFTVTLQRLEPVGTKFNFGCTSRGIGHHISMTQQRISKTQRATLMLQLAARQDELYTCRTPAQIAAVQSEIDRLHSLLLTGFWPAG